MASSTWDVHPSAAFMKTLSCLDQIPHSTQSFSSFSKQKYSRSTVSESGWIRGHRAQERRGLTILYATLYNIRDLSICGFWYGGGVSGTNLPQIPKDNCICYVCSKIPSTFICTSNAYAAFHRYIHNQQNNSSHSLRTSYSLSGLTWVPWNRFSLNLIHLLCRV